MFQVLPIGSRGMTFSSAQDLCQRLPPIDSAAKEIIQVGNPKVGGCDASHTPPRCAIGYKNRKSLATLAQRLMTFL